MKNKSYAKTLAMLALVLAITASLWIALPATVSYAQGGYGVSGGGGAPVAGIASLSGIITSKGALLEDVTAKSADKLCKIELDKGTNALNKWGQPLSSIIIKEMEDPPAAPQNAKVIGRVYDFWPGGANFDPPMSLNITYTPALLPADVIEENLVIAMWDTQAGKWSNLVSNVDPVSNAINAQVSHFSAFTVVAYTRPAAFTTTGLVISPAEVDVGKTTTVSVSVANTGDITGSYTITLKIDGVVVDTKDVSLAGGASQQVTFTIVKDVAGTFAIRVDGLSGSLVVKTPTAPPVPPKPAAFTTSALTISPTEVGIGESLTISAMVTNTGEVTGSYEVILKIDSIVEDTKNVTLAGGAGQQVTFTAVKVVAATYEVEVNGQHGTFTVVEPVSSAFPWWWIVIGIVVIGLLVYTLIIRRRAA